MWCTICGAKVSKATLSNIAQMVWYVSTLDTTDSTSLGGERAVPATSKKQKAFMGAELSRKRAGKETRTDMSEESLEHYASTKIAKAIDKKGKKRGSRASY